MPREHAANLGGYHVHVDREAKQKFLNACREYGISGNEAIERFMEAVLKAKAAGVDFAMVGLQGDGSRVPDAPLPGDRRTGKRA